MVARLLPLYHKVLLQSSFVFTYTDRFTTLVTPTPKTPPGGQIQNNLPQPRSQLQIRYYPVNIHDIHIQFQNNINTGKNLTVVLEWSNAPSITQYVLIYSEIILYQCFLVYYFHFNFVWCWFKLTLQIDKSSIFQYMTLDYHTWFPPLQCGHQVLLNLHSSLIRKLIDRNKRFHYPVYLISGML